MPEMVYPRFILKSHRSLIIFSMLITSLLQYLIIFLISSMEIAPILSMMLDQLPPQMRMLISDEFLSQFSVTGAAAFGLNHPLVLALLSIAAITIPARHIAGEAETGTLELILSTPVSRTRHLMQLWFSGCIAIFLICFAGLTGSLVSLAINHHLDITFSGEMLKIAFNLFLLFTLIMSFTLYFSTSEREGGKVGIRAASITLFFYFLKFLSSIWKPIEFTDIFNIFNYYQPQKLMFAQRSFSINIGVLSSLILILVLGSLRKFNKRDIPG